MEKAIYRAKAPLRLGFGGGGTDLPVYASQFGGAIINATIGKYAHASLEFAVGLDHIEFVLADQGRRLEQPTARTVACQDGFALQGGVHNRMFRQFRIPPRPYRLTTRIDAPPGSGLGSSSTLVVAMVAAFSLWRRLPLGEYELARLAYEIEREDLSMAGGKQDQFAAAFGGFNFMEFETNGSVLVNPLRVKREFVSELEHQCLLVNTRTSRYSSEIIEQQSRAVRDEGGDRLQALHDIKRDAYDIKRALLTGDIAKFGQALHRGWQNKKRSASRISTTRIDEIYQAALEAGAAGGKVSGAGGGGYMFFICPGNSRYAVEERMAALGVGMEEYGFVENGCLAWQAETREKALI
jgi:D-glycero-alpha-D-manno-heptose-7-phosphate kinase